MRTGSTLSFALICDCNYALAKASRVNTRHYGPRLGPKGLQYGTKTPDERVATLDSHVHASLEFARRL